MTDFRTPPNPAIAMLAHDLLTHPDSPAPTRWVLCLHGLLGSRSNWRGIATRWIATQAGWGAVLVDLRMHGESQAFAPPHTIASAAADLVELQRALGLRIDAVLGHSFGGKVALQYVQLASATPQVAWIVDSPPGPRVAAEADATTLNVIAHLRSMPAVFESRNQFVSSLVAGGFNDSLARWLALNLVRRDGGLMLRVDLSAITDLLHSHYSSDLWPVIASMHERVSFRFVIGGRSTVFVADQRQRALALAEAGKLEVHTLPEAGHWVHADDPDGLLALLTTETALRPR